MSHLTSCRLEPSQWTSFTFPSKHHFSERRASEETPPSTDSACYCIKAGPRGGRGSVSNRLLQLNSEQRWRKVLPQLRVEMIPSPLKQILVPQLLTPMRYLCLSEN